MIDKVGGLRELHDFLQQLPVRLEKNILRGMVRAAAKPVADAARAKAPVLKEDDPRRVPGALAKSVRIMSTVVRGAEVKGGVAAGGRVNVKKGRVRGETNAFYAPFVEYGTKNMAAQPFMRPAADTQFHAAIDVGAAYVRERVDAGDLKK
jgi:HK97 gp10 family phage protein